MPSSRADTSFAAATASSTLAAEPPPPPTLRGVDMGDARPVPRRWAAAEDEADGAGDRFGTADALGTVRALDDAPGWACVGVCDCAAARENAADRSVDTP
jgi:hypothetical protein